MQGRYLTNQELASLGRQICDVSYKHSDDDHKAFEILHDALDQEFQLGNEIAFIIHQSLKIPSEQLLILWCGRWYEQGLPRIVLDEKYAALLMATEATEESLEFVVSPWRAFLIQVPPGLLQVFCHITQADVDILRISVQTMINQDGSLVWNFIAEGTSGVKLWRHGLSLHQLIHVDTNDMSPIPEYDIFMSTLEDKDERVMTLVGRLIVSTCLAMSNPANFREQKQNKGRAKKFVFNKENKSIRNYILGQPIVVDCRPAIRSYVQGTRKGSVPKVRFLVRGHWRRQPYGEGNKLRKLVQILPYWKGSEEARIETIREVKLKNLL